LDEATHQGGIVVNEDVRAVRDWLAVMQRVDQQEELAVLVARRVQQLVVRAGELPVDEEGSGVSIGSRVDGQAGGQGGGAGGRVGPEFYDEKIARIMPWRRSTSRCTGAFAMPVCAKRYATWGAALRGTNVSYI
jgi:hypothetical protein